VDGNYYKKVSGSNLMRGDAAGQSDHMEL